MVESEEITRKVTSPYTNRPGGRKDASALTIRNHNTALVENIQQSVSHVKDIMTGPTRHLLRAGGPYFLDGTPDKLSTVDVQYSLVPDPDQLIPQSWIQFAIQYKHKHFPASPLEEHSHIYILKDMLFKAWAGITLTVIEGIPTLTVSVPSALKKEGNSLGFKPSYPQEFTFNSIIKYSDPYEKKLVGISLSDCDMEMLCKIIQYVLYNNSNGLYDVPVDSIRKVLYKMRKENKTWDTHTAPLVDRSKIIHKHDFDYLGEFILRYFVVPQEILTQIQTKNTAEPYKTGKKMGLQIKIALAEYFSVIHKNGGDTTRFSYGDWNWYEFCEALKKIPGLCLNEEGVKIFPGTDNTPKSLGEWLSELSSEIIEKGIQTIRQEMEIPKLAASARLRNAKIRKWSSRGRNLRETGIMVVKIVAFGAGFGGARFLGTAVLYALGGILTGAGVHRLPIIKGFIGPQVTRYVFGEGSDTQNPQLPSGNQ